MKLASAVAAAGLVSATLVVTEAGADIPRYSASATTVSNNEHAGGDRTELLIEYCLGCHNDLDQTGGLSMDDLQGTDLATGAYIDIWEKILHKLTLGEMPPKGKDRPQNQEVASFRSWAEASLDNWAVANPDPGRATLRRLNRQEYANAVRDLLDLDVDVSAQLPADDSGYGFDNIADVLTTSPTLVDRYMVVAGRAAYLATGLASEKPVVTEYKIPKDANTGNKGIPAYNERTSDALPIDSRGGGSFRYFAPHDGQYLIRLTLNSNMLEDTETVPETMLELKIDLKAGVRVVGAAFQRSLDLDESVQTIYSNSLGRKDPVVPKYGVVVPDHDPIPLKLDLRVDGIKVEEYVIPSYLRSQHFFQGSYLRDILKMSVTGPYGAANKSETASQKRVFICRPTTILPEANCARRIFSSLARLAYRRPETKGDVESLMNIYEIARVDSDFEHGIAAGIQAMLISPSFLFVRESSPLNMKPGSVFQISGFELATRLALFLWSSIPDAELLLMAQQGKLSDRSVLNQQIERMLDDPRAAALTENFAGQWLFLRNIDNQKPDVVAFPGFDERLRSAMRTESEFFFANIVKENRSILEFIRSDYTFLNERLAEHYDIRGVYGPALRKVKLDPAWNRGGLLGQASILTVTSYDNRTSIVKRGNWILESLLAAPPPPPPPDIPALTDAAGGKSLSVREQMEIHRAKPQCAVCHDKMDPFGLALENYDAVGAWRERDAGYVIDASTELLDGTPFSGPSGLQDVLLARKDSFTEAFIERMMTYAVGRGLESADKPAIREIRRAAAANGYRMHTIILGIAESIPFQKRKVSEE